MAKTKRGRKRGSRNTGFWFRAGRGWYVTEGNGYAKLCDPEGNHIRDQEAEQEAKAAYHRYMAGQENGEKPRPQEGGKAYTVKDICLIYLKDVKNPATYELRKRLLMDLCEGGPPDGKKVHKGYGDLPINKLIGLHVKEWLDSHNWKGTRRAAVQAIRRAILYCKDLGMVKENPIAGFKAGPAGKREAYITEEQEKTIYRIAPRTIAEMIQVMIRTGARPSEFAKLEARQVEETEHGQLWRYRPGEHKTGWKTKKDRVIPVCPEIAAIVREKIKRHPKGKLFRNKVGKPWTPTGMKSAFARLRKNLAKLGIKLAPDNTLYACRHTYAKRAIMRGITVEKLAARMGNSPAVCWEHYAADWDKQKDSAPVLFEGLV